MSFNSGDDTSMLAALALVEAAASRPSPANRFNIDREGPAKRARKLRALQQRFQNERILRRDRRRNSRLARAGAAALVRKKPAPAFPEVNSSERLRPAKAGRPIALQCIPH